MQIIPNLTLLNLSPSNLVIFGRYRGPSEHCTRRSSDKALHRTSEELGICFKVTLQMCMQTNFYQDQEHMDTFVGKNFIFVDAAVIELLFQLSGPN